MKKVQTPLFQGITENEWNEMQNCSCMRQQSFEKMNLFSNGRIRPRNRNCSDGKC